MQNASDNFFQAKIALEKNEEFCTNFTRNHDVFIDIQKVAIQEDSEVAVMSENMIHFFREAICDNFGLLLDCALEKQIDLVKEFEERAIFEYKTKMDNKINE